MSEIASRTIVWASSPNGSRCCAFSVRVLRSVSWSVHSWSDTIPRHGASTSCSPSSIAFARTTSSSAVSSATLPISLRYIRTGSSIPIMSALIASRSSAVGSSTSARVELGRGVERQLRVDGLAVGADDLDPDVALGLGRHLARGHLDRVVVLLVGFDLRQGDLRGAQATRRELRLLDVGAGPARPGQDGFDELLIERI